MRRGRDARPDPDPLLRDQLRTETSEVERVVARVRLVAAVLFVVATVAQLLATGRIALLGSALPFWLAAIVYTVVADLAAGRVRTPTLSYVTTTIDALIITGASIQISLAADRPDFTTKTPTTTLYFALLVAAGMRQSQGLAIYATALVAVLYAALVVPPAVLTPEAITLNGIGLDDLSSTRVAVGRVFIVDAFLVITGILVVMIVRRTRRLVGRALDTRTFLFADLRGYTTYVEQHGDLSAARLMASYRELVRREIARTGGGEIKTEGDSFYVVFESARQALSCGIGILRAAESDPPIDVGVGIHAGEPVPHDGQFVGSAVNIAARLAQVSAAGELLVSDVIRGLLRTSGLPPLAERSVTLKGISEPPRVFAVEWRART